MKERSKKVSEQLRLGGGSFKRKASFASRVRVFVEYLNRTTCGLDPFSTKLLMSHLSSSINIILRTRYCESLFLVW